MGRQRHDSESNSIQLLPPPGEVQVPMAGAVGGVEGAIWQQGQLWGPDRDHGDDSGEDDI